MAIESMLLTTKNYPDALAVINELAELEDRKPTDSVQRLIVQAGREKIAQLKAKSQEQSAK
jgi:hypothetical protein